MLAAGLLARNAVKRGLKVKPWVKTSLAPGSQVVTDYYAAAGLQHDLDALGFNLVGYGCTTCIGNSGPLAEPIARRSTRRSGRRRRAFRQPQFRRPHQPLCPRQLSRLAAAGRRLCHRRLDERRSHKDPLGDDSDGKPVYLNESGPRTRSRRHRRTVGDRRDVPQALRQRLRGPGGVAEGRSRRRPHLSLGSRLDLCRKPALFRRHAEGAGRARRRRMARAARPARRQHHHRPHLAGRLDQEGRPGRRSTCSSTRRGRPTSTPTARGAAITR